MHLTLLLAWGVRAGLLPARRMTLGWQAVPNHLLSACSEPGRCFCMKSLGRQASRTTRVFAMLLQQGGK